MVATFIPEAPKSEEVRRKLMSAPATDIAFRTPLQCLGEFWRVSTEPRGYGRDPASTLGFLTNWLKNAPLLLPGEDFAERLLETLSSLAPRGATVFDLMIASGAISAGVSEIWTIDRGFPTLSSLHVVHI